MVSEQSRWLLATVTVVGLACGQTATPGKKNGATVDPPKTIPTTQVKTDPKPEQKPLPAIWQQVPSSAFMAVVFNHPTQSTTNLRDALSKIGVFAEFYKEGDFDDFQEAFGIDFFDVEAAKKLGIDESKGAALVFDSKFVYKRHPYQEYSATIQTYRDPAIFAILPLADEKTFDTWMRTTVTKESPETTFEEETVGGAKFIYMMSSSTASSYGEKPIARAPAPMPLPVPGTLPVTPKHLEATFVIKGSNAYVFAHSVYPSEIKDMPDYIAEFKTDLKKYVDGMSASPITGSSAFTTVTKKLNTAGDLLMFMDVNGFVTYSEADLNQEVLYLPTKNESQKLAQEDEKRYATDVSWRTREHNFFKKMATIFPAWGMSAELKKDSKDGAVCEGYAMLGPAAQAAFGTLMNLTTEPPPYSTMFPEDTTFVYRESINFSALKSVIEMFIEDDDKDSFNRDYNDLKTGSLAGLGLDFEKDVLTSFTGHVAFGAPDLSILIMPFFSMAEPHYEEKAMPASVAPAVIERAPVPSPIQLDPSLPQDVPAPRLMAPMPPTRPAPAFPAVVGIAQLTSPAAGDKIVEALLRLAPLTGMQYKTEEASGEKFYWMEIDGVTVAGARVDSYLLFATGTEKLKQTIERIKKPGTNFTDKLMTPMSKSLVNDKNASGCTGDVGGMFSWFLKQPDLRMDAEELAVVTKLSAGLGVSTMKMTYEDNGLACKGELTLR